MLNDVIKLKESRKSLIIRVIQADIVEKEVGKFKQQQFEELEKYYLKSRQI